MTGINQVELPVTAPAPNEVLVRVGAVSLNYRDLLVIRGEEDWRPRERRILCSDAAGVVTPMGRNVSSVKPGDRVANCFKQDWLSGRLTAGNSGPGPGAQAMDAVLAEHRVFRSARLCPFPITSQSRRPRPFLVPP